MSTITLEPETPVYEPFWMKDALAELVLTEINQIRDSLGAAPITALPKGRIGCAQR